MKKVLSWVLALALVLSSFSMAFAGDLATASTMKDADKIANKEAVDVMVATGIIGGYPDGSFYPEKTVTRAEMAKMITLAVNGGEDVGGLYAKNCTFADSKNHWAAGYIAYCASEGIIAGRDANTFDPDATVTGTEAAKMILVALGYDAKIEKLTGAEWETKTLKLAKSNKLFDGVTKSFVAGAALSRDNAAQLIFNGLQAEMVKYDTNTEISTGDITVAINTTVKGKGRPLFADSFDGDLAYDAKAGVTDDFGRPGHKWTFEKEEIGTYVDAADYTFVADDNFETVAAAVKDYNKKYTAKTSKMNGNDATDVKKGDVVELYETAVADTYNVVIARYVADRISEVNTDVKTADKEDGVKAYVIFENAGKYNDDVVAGYDAAKYVEDAVVALAKNAEGVILDSYVLEKTTGDYTKNYTNKIYVGTTAYNNIGTDLVKFDGPTVEDKVDLYTINGYAAAIVKVEEGSSVEYGILLKVGETAFSGKIAKIYTADAKVVDYEVDSDVGNKIVAGNVGELFAYSVNDDGTIDVENKAVTAMEATSLTKSGLLDGKVVVDNVVVFDYSGTDDAVNKEDKDNYAVYKYADLKDADGLAGKYMLNKDGDIAAVYTTSGVTSSNTIVGVYKAKEAANNAGKDIFNVTLLVNGEEVNYDTTSKVVADSFSGIAANEFVAIKLNSAGEISAIAEATKTTDSLVPSDDFGGKDYLKFNTTTYDTFVSKSGNKVTLKDADNADNTYTVTFTGKAIYSKGSKTGTIKADSYTLADIDAGAAIELYKFSEETDTWDVIIFTVAEK